jgi:hypothetical protein
MPSRRSRKSHVLAVQAMELGFAAPQVIAHRVMRMAVAGSSPSLRDRKEFYLMGAEKVAAFYESWNAMLLEMFCANLKSLSTAPLFWFSWPTSMGYSRAASTRFQRAALAVLGKGVAPVHRRAVANAKRLSDVRGR